MSFKDKFGNIVKQASDLIESSNLKEKVVNIKDKTIDKVKKIDNPEHYTAPNGFTLFDVPVPELKEDLENLKTFSLKEEKNVVDAYIRLLSLLTMNEQIICAITASLQKTYLLVWTSKDRIIITHKEHYKILNREEVKTLKIESSGVLGMSFFLNEYRFSGSEKSKIYVFIRKFCHEMTPEYTFKNYEAVSKDLNYYERFKLDRLKKENDATTENKMISVLLDPFEFPLVSVFGTHDRISYVLVLSTEEKLYLINQKQYAIFSMDEIRKIEMTNKGVFNSEFYLDNYYFTGVGPEDSMRDLISFCHDRESYLKAKDEFLKEHQLLMTFPFKNATSYETTSGSGIIIALDEQSFLIRSSFGQMDYYKKDQFDHYEFIKEEKIDKENMWTSQIGNDLKSVVTMEEALENFDRASIKIFVKQEDITLELPFILTKKVVYKDVEERHTASIEVIKQLVDQLEHLK